MENFKCFSCAMQSVLEEAVSGSIDFCEDMTLDQLSDPDFGTLAEKFAEYARLATPAVIYENACIMLQNLMDPDASVEITNNQKLALMELVLDRVRLKYSKKGN